MPQRSSIIRDALAIGVACALYAVSYGVLAVAAGLSVAQTCAMSLLVFTGASQFAVVGVIGTGGGAAAALAPALLLAARNAVYGLSLVPAFRAAGRGRAARALESQLIIDESTAMARAHEENPHRAFLATGLSVFFFWNLGSLLGALAGSGLGDPRDYGLDAMFPAAFLALLAPQLRRPGAPTGAIVGALIAVALLPFAPAGTPVLAAVVGVIPAMIVVRRALERGASRGGDGAPAP